MPSTKNPWLDALGGQEAELASLKRELSLEQQIARSYSLICASLDKRLETLQAVLAAVAGSTGAEQLLSDACKALVRQLGWSVAVALRLDAEGCTILGSAQLAKAQAENVRRHASKTPAFASAYAARRETSTFRHGDAESLALRVLFTTDNVTVLPLVAGGEHVGCLVLCSNVEERARDDGEAGFLRQLADSLAAACSNMGRDLQ